MTLLTQSFQKQHADPPGSGLQLIDAQLTEDDLVELEMQPGQIGLFREHLRVRSSLNRVVALRCAAIPMVT